jgi:hypothetical protein
MKQSDIFRENAENCLRLAEATSDEPSFRRSRRMATAWRALAEEQDWLDGEVPPETVPERIQTVPPSIRALIKPRL